MLRYMNFVTAFTAQGKGGGGGGGGRAFKGERFWVKVFRQGL